MANYAMTKSRNKHAVTTRDLYGSSSLSDDDLVALRYLLSEVGAFGIYPLKMYDEYQWMSDYLKNRGMKWSDMKYPAIAPKSGVGVKWSLSKKALKRLYE